MSTPRGEAIRLVTAADTLANDLWTIGDNHDQTRHVDKLQIALYDAWIAVAGGDHDKAARLAREVIAAIATPPAAFCRTREPHGPHRVDEDRVEGQLVSWLDCPGTADNPLTD